mmetsp:Transcript_65488/g.152033  ORF Transcript_65488/g.152033 Transcript_65488/m.152033 type:complete len:218 (+) Transcript_65488:240-893(+)
MTRRITKVRRIQKPTWRLEPREKQMLLLAQARPTTPSKVSLFIMSLKASHSEATLNSTACGSSNSVMRSTIRKTSMQSNELHHSAARKVHSLDCAAPRCVATLCTTRRRASRNGATKATQRAIICKSTFTVPEPRHNTRSINVRGKFRVSGAMRFAMKPPRMTYKEGKQTPTTSTTAAARLVSAARPAIVPLRNGGNSLPSPAVRGVLLEPSSTMLR